MPEDISPQWQKGLSHHPENKKNEYKTFRIEMVNFYSDFKDFGEKTETMFIRLDSKIEENRRFTYPVFIPSNPVNYRSCILLLHGLNERNWDKYLGWAEYLAVHTGKPVILFPIAFHMNRSPASWRNPRMMRLLMEQRKKEAGNSPSLSFANAAISKRLSEEPYRFYCAGKQTIMDIIKLARQIRKGAHSLFKKGTVIDIFGYSIGSFLAEIMLMANPGKLFSDSRLFIFCGGAIFRHMYGESRYIMDRAAYENLLNYYCNVWPRSGSRGIAASDPAAGSLQHAFTSMISPDINSVERENFFKNMKGRISGISLRKDKVMPYSGVEACMGSKLAEEYIDIMDFPFEYSHETPFPAKGQASEYTIRSSFFSVFSKCAAFFK
jgi:hypothetical protein